MAGYGEDIPFLDMTGHIGSRHCNAAFLERGQSRYLRIFTGGVQVGGLREWAVCLSQNHCVSKLTAREVSEGVIFHRR